MAKDGGSNLIDALEDAGRDWQEYSGRGMFGAQCVGTKIQNIDELFLLGQQLDDFPSPRLDSMGCGYIAYWPSFKTVDQELYEALDEAINYIPVYAAAAQDKKASALLNRCTAALAKVRGEQ